MIRSHKQPDLTYGSVHRLAKTITYPQPHLKLINGTYIGEKENNHYFGTQSGEIYVTPASQPIEFIALSEGTPARIRVSAYGTIERAVEREFLRTIIEKHAKK